MYHKSCLPNAHPPFSLTIAPDDVSLKVWRAEANMGLRHFSDALHDLDEVCTIRPNWTEVCSRAIHLL